MPQIRSRLLVVSAIALLVVVNDDPGYAMQARAGSGRAKATGTTKTSAKPEYRDFKVPAGTLLSIQLGTDASSDVSRPDDPIGGRLSAPLTSEGTELVPSGTPVFGSVKHVTAASRDDGPGRLELMFNLIEHPETRSRVGIRTAPVRFAGEMVKARRHGFSVVRPTDVRLEHGTEVSATLLEPFIVRLPIPK
jgi:hypothetical protein